MAARKIGGPRRKPRRASPEADTPQIQPPIEPQRDELEEIQRAHPDNYQSEK